PWQQDSTKCSIQRSAGHPTSHDPHSQEPATADYPLQVRDPSTTTTAVRELRNPSSRSSLMSFASSSPKKANASTAGSQDTELPTASLQRSHRPTGPSQRQGPRESKTSHLNPNQYRYQSPRQHRHHHQNR